MKKMGLSLLFFFILYAYVYPTPPGFQYGFIDKKGTIVIKPQFDDTEPFSEGLAGFRIKDYWGFIDNSGAIVIELQFEEAMSFSDGLAAVRKNGKWGYIDKTGEIVIEIQYDSVGDFLRWFG